MIFTLFYVPVWHVWNENDDKTPRIYGSSVFQKGELKIEAHNFVCLILNSVPRCSYTKDLSKGETWTGYIEYLP